LLEGASPHTQFQVVGLRQVLIVRGAGPERKGKKYCWPDYDGVKNSWYPADPSILRRSAAGDARLTAGGTPALLGLRPTTKD